MNSLYNIKQRNQGLLNLIFVTGLICFYLAGILFANEFRVYGFLFGAILSTLVIVALYYFQLYQESKKRKIETTLQRIRKLYQDNATKKIDEKSAELEEINLKHENVELDRNNLRVTIWEAQGDVSKLGDKIRYSQKHFSLPISQLIEPDYGKTSMPLHYHTMCKMGLRNDNFFYSQELIDFYVNAINNPKTARKNLVYLEENLKILKQEIEILEKKSKIQ